MRKVKLNKGFTLIELLIVIAIIGILAAVLIPNLLSARARANDAVAKAFLSEAAQQQEIFYIDSNAYADAWADFTASYGDLNADLTTSGARFENLSSTTTATGNPSIATATDGQSYCLQAAHINGSESFFITNGSSVQDGTCPTATP